MQAKVIFSRRGLTTAYNMAVLAGINLLTLSIGLYKYRRVQEKFSD